MVIRDILERWSVLLFIGVRGLSEKSPADHSNQFHQWAISGFLLYVLTR